MASGVRLSMQIRGELVAKKFEDFTAEAPKVGAGRVRGRVESAKKKVSTAPANFTGAPKHRWPEGVKGKRARSWYFRALALGIVNPPGKFQRSGGYQASWVIEKVENGYRLRSTYPAAKYMAGTARDPDAQYHIHKRRWVPIRRAFDEAVEGLPKEIQDSVIMVARRKGL